MKILIVDDDVAISDVWSLWLKREGFEVISATTGRDGFNLAKKDMPDLILLDQILPDIKGNDVLRMLKQDPQAKGIPVALVSNYSENNLMQEAIQLGATDYILKFQIEPQDLVNRSKTLIQDGNKDYQTLVTNAIQKQLTIFGPGIALIKLRRIPGLAIADDGTITSMPDDPRSIIKPLVDEFNTLSPSVVKKTMKPLLLLTQSIADLKKQAQQEVIVPPRTADQ